MRGAAPPPARPVQQSHGRGFALSPPSVMPRAERLPFDVALSAYVPPAASAPPAVESAAGAGSATAPRELPSDLVPLGQVQESFIVATNAEGLWIVDQHAAHERVLFDRHVQLRRQRKVEGQRLLMPIIVELKAAQRVTFQTIADELAANGFEVEPFGQGTVAVKTAPAEIAAGDVETLMLEILEGAGGEGAEISLEALRGKIAASISCHAAIKVNMGLERSKMEWLLQALSQTACPMTCPHGRPTVLRYDMKDLQKAFKRL